ncbi:MAG: uroporphyrinogen-III C-methyltransferase [Rudaea sp.]
MIDGVSLRVLTRKPPSRVAGHLPGIVHLVGAGPGDPELLTLGAVRRLEQADAILFDHLVAPEILDFARRDALRVYVGKQRDRHTMPQERINEMLVRLARQGQVVVRLKGGDPFVFGRGGEEVEALARAGIAFEVVPGITAGLGVASYAGIPLTHRDHAQACVFVAGQLKDGAAGLDFAALARPRQTIVIYMGLLALPVICRELIAHGLGATMPAAIVQAATTPRQKVVVGTLETLPGLANAHAVEPPALAIVGNVVRLHEKLAWFGPSATEAPAPAALRA